MIKHYRMHHNFTLIYCKFVTLDIIVKHRATGYRVIYQRNYTNRLISHIAWNSGYKPTHSSHTQSLAINHPDTLDLSREPDAYTIRFVSSCLCVGFAHINTASYICSDAMDLATAVKLNLIYMQMTVLLRMAVRNYKRCLVS